MAHRIEALAALAQSLPLLLVRQLQPQSPRALPRSGRLVPLLLHQEEKPLSLPGLPADQVEQVGLMPAPFPPEFQLHYCFEEEPARMSVFVLQFHPMKRHLALGLNRPSFHFVYLEITLAVGETLTSAHPASRSPASQV